MVSARQTDTTIARDTPPKGNEPQGRCRRVIPLRVFRTCPRFGRATTGRQAPDRPASGTIRHLGDGPRPDFWPRSVSRTPAAASANAGTARLHLGGDRLVRPATLPRFGARTSQSAAKTCAADLPSGRSVSRRQPRLPNAPRPTPAPDGLVNPIDGSDSLRPRAREHRRLSRGCLLGGIQRGTRSMCQARSTPPSSAAFCPAHIAYDDGTRTGNPTTSRCGILCSGAQGHGRLSWNCSQLHGRSRCRKTPRPSPVSTRGKRRRGRT
jgi:hypothetical protein